VNPKNLLIVQGGGPSPVFNVTFAGVVREARSNARIGNIFGAVSGMAGLARGEIRELNYLQPADLDAIERSPGAILGSSRSHPEEKDLETAVEYLRKSDIGCVIFMGGNGTMKGAASFARFCRSSNYDVQIIGIPKTVDNDIAGTDRCPGFASAARYIAQTTLELSADLRSLPKSVTIMETLGRDSGWLAASANLAKRSLNDAPHLVYVPELPFSLDQFLGEIDAVFTRFGWAMVVVAEGISYGDGTRVFEQEMSATDEQNARPLIGGVAQHLAGLVGDKMGIRCRSEKPGLIGRSCMAHIALRDRIDAELVGRDGVLALVAGESDGMVALQPLDHRGSSATHLVPLESVEGRERPLPKEWLTADGLAVGVAFRRFTQPLVGDLTFPVYPSQL
jgi:6-phosphofructokinase